MNSTIASHINGGTNINQQVASRSHSSLLLSSIEFALTETKTNFSVPSYQGKHLIKLSGKEELFNGQKKVKNCDQNKNPLENCYISVNGNKEKTPEDTNSIPTPKVQLYSGKIHTEWDQVYKIGAGLHNLGNTCFMNTVIQCLTYCPPLANYLLHDNDHSSKCTITGFCMMCLLQRHIRRAIGKTGEVIKPIDVYQRLKLIARHFQFGRQEDAHEFLRYVVDHLWKSCLPQSNGITKLDPASKETTVINKIFGGYHRSQVICMRCKKESNTFDHFMDFILDIKQNVMTLEKALEKFIQPELLQQENSYKCPKCKMKVEAQKRFSVYQAPNVATFQLKRFDYNRSFGGKITKQIIYPEKLNLRPYMSDTQGDPVWYHLNAVLVHSGPSCNSGHYYCYVRNSNGFWYIMDDQRVNQVSLNQVLNQSAYVLFYIKMESSERAPLKRCLDNKNSLVKGTISNSNFGKVPVTSNLKSMPLAEKMSPFESPKQPFSSPNNVKKISFPLIQKPEKVSFNFRTSVPSPTKKILPSVTSSTSGGLVPYVEDSSESSDASESNQALNKHVNTLDSDSKQNGKNSILQSYLSTPRLEIKTKLSKSVFSSSTRSVSSPVPKVRATGSWTVTDTSEACASNSSSSTCTVNSTTDWHVTSAVNDTNISKDNENQDFNENKTSDLVNISLNETQVSNHSENIFEISEHVQNSATKLTDYDNQSQKSNFRKQLSKNKTHVLQNEKTINSPKRKSSDFPSEGSLDSSLTEHSESGHIPIPKKIKYSEKSPSLSKENGVLDSNSQLGIKNLESSPRQHISNSNSVSRTNKFESLSLSQNGELPFNHKSAPSTFINDVENKNSKSSPEQDVFSKGKHKERSFFTESSKSLQNENKFSDSSQGKNTSLYGTDVPTWKEENYHRPSIIPAHGNSRSFDDYDNEFDRGKVRKSKMKDRYQYFHRKNPFQKHVDKYHNKYKGKFYNSHHNHRKPYDSHFRWKSHHHDGYQRYRNYHHRYY